MMSSMLFLSSRVTSIEFLISFNIHRICIENSFRFLFGFVFMLSQGVKSEEVTLQKALELLSYPRELVSTLDVANMLAYRTSGLA